MSKNSSAKSYQDNKERLQKSLMKDIKVFRKKKKKKCYNMIMNDIKISLRMKKKGCLSIETNIAK